MKNFFEIYFLACFIIGSIVRGLGVSKAKAEKIDFSHATLPDKIMLNLSVFGIIAPLFYLFTNWLGFANYSLPVWISVIGVIFFPLGILLLWRSHVDLGKNWFSTLNIRKGHTLVTSGIFAHIRHPMYLAHIFWGLAQLFLIPNWIAGPLMLAFMIPLFIYRIPREEKMMLEKFGEEYRSYIKRSGALIPKI